MKTTEEIKEIPAGASPVDVAKILTRGLWLFESKPRPDGVTYDRILDVMGQAVYDIGGGGSDVDEVAFIRGGLARSLAREIPAA